MKGEPVRVRRKGDQETKPNPKHLKLSRIIKEQASEKREKGRSLEGEEEARSGVKAEMAYGCLRTSRRVILRFKLLAFVNLLQLPRPSARAHKSVFCCCYDYYLGFK